MRTRAEDVKGLGRVVRGIVTASGGISSGSGFTVAKAGTGIYNITLNAPIRSNVTPKVISGLSPMLAYPNSWTASTLQVITVNTAGAAVDAGFIFEVTEADPA